MQLVHSSEYCAFFATLLTNVELICRMNHPEAVVWHLCMNAVTRHVDSEGKEDGIQTLRHGKQPFPAPGAIDIQVGGSPW